MTYTHTTQQKDIKYITSNHDAQNMKTNTSLLHECGIHYHEFFVSESIFALLGRVRVKVKV